MLVGGYVIVFVYVLVMLGRWDCVEQKVYLSMGGILGVMMGHLVCHLDHVGGHVGHFSRTGKEAPTGREAVGCSPRLSAYCSTKT